MAEPVRVLLLGAGTVGASIGLALRRAGPNFERIAFDPRPGVAEAAQKAGAVDHVVSNPSKAAPKADLVLLSLSPAQAIDAAQGIADRLPAEVVVLCASRVPSSRLEEIRTQLGSDHPCLGAFPFLGPGRALAAAGPDAAGAADRFDGGMLGIVAPSGTPQGAIEIALDLAAILHATPFFLEAVELDSVAATSDELPGALAAALLESLPANPGWRDQRRLVGRPFAGLVGLLEGNPAELADEWIANRDPLIARLDAFAEQLAEVRDRLAAGDEAALAARLEAAIARREEWRAYRTTSRPDHGVEFADVPRVDVLERLLGTGLTKKRS